MHAISQKEIDMINGKSKEQLMNELPAMWKSFWVAYKNACCIAKLAAALSAYVAVRAATGVNVWDNYLLEEYSEGHTLEDIFGIFSDEYLARDDNGITTWRPGGGAYAIVQDYDLPYWQRLTLTLMAQTEQLLQII